MPARVVDGVGVWRSKKLKRVSPRFRGEYANLLPLAEANGVFDCDVDRIWSDVYAFNRPEITLSDVVQIMDELEEAHLLYRWAQDGKTWGYWTGIHKSGRLPPTSHLNRYKNLPPDAPPEGLVQDNPGSVQTSPSRIGLDWIGIGLVKEPAAQLETSQDKDTDMKAKKQIPTLCLQLLGVKAESYANVWLQVNDYERATSSGQVINEFTEWAELNKGDDFNGKPVSAFLRSLSNTQPTEQKKAATDPVVVNLVRELVYHSDSLVTFSDKAKAGLAAEIKKGFTAEEIVSVFRKDFFPRAQDDEFKMRNAGTDFVQTIDGLVSAMRRKRQERDQEAQVVAGAAERMQRDAEAERTRLRVANEQEIAAVEETLGGGE